MPKANGNSEFPPAAQEDAKAVGEMCIAFRTECSGMTLAEAAAHLRITPIVVCRLDCLFPGVVDTNRGKGLHERIHRAVRKAPALAAQGLTMNTAARRLDMSPHQFRNAMTRHLPNLRFVSFRSSAAVRQIVERARALAAEGLTKTEAARRLGVDAPNFTAVAHRYLKDVTWVDGRFKRGGTRLTVFDAQSRFIAECKGMTSGEVAAHLGIARQTALGYSRLHPGVLAAGPPRRSSSEASTTRLILERAPALAAEGLFKTEAARQLGIDPMYFITITNRYLRNTKWADGRSKTGGKSRGLSDVPSPTCVESGCNRAVKAKGLCVKHYWRHRRHGDSAKTLRRGPLPRTCSVPGCAGAHQAKGLCMNHYMAMRRAKSKERTSA